MPSAIAFIHLYQRKLLIFANIISEKGLISSIYKELSKLNSLKFLRKKWAKEKENKFYDVTLDTGRSNKENIFWII